MRPEGFENLYPEDFRNGKPYGSARIWEDCADYMVEILRKMGTHLTAEDHADPMYQLYFHTGQEPILPGTWVFIPDEETDDKD